MSSDRHAERFVDVRRSESSDGVLWRLTVWRLGGCINGSAQPFKILDVYECSQEFQVGYLIEQSFADAKYAPVPTMIDDRLYVYDLSFKGGTLL